MTCSGGTTDRVRHYEGIKNAAIARLIADLLGCRFAGQYEEQKKPEPTLYFVPHRTIVGLDYARSLGIADATDFYGGIVPFGYLATKAITHGLVDPKASAPPGWCEAFSRATADVVLPGYTVFHKSDACIAGLRLLTDDAVRVKSTSGVGGQGQYVVYSPDDLTDALRDLDPEEIAQRGLVLERKLADVSTYSVGQIQIGALIGSYCGTQRLTTDNRGQTSYGGSDLIVVRGGYDQLLQVDLPESLRLAIRQAAVYDEAVQLYPDILASRRNYDVAQGLDGRGNVLTGVLEQSWRIGGASGPEVAALCAFRDDPRLQVVEASSFEQYGADRELPPGALVHFAGVDPDCGPLQVYTILRT
ncbi:MAG TPA: DUF3182 family protein [Dehalococcoidia bacterium]|nr:DUF3182 family protein [Dehalococcoidia bacterium]